ncbi:MAG: hypothetical protein ABID54_12335 [Pseudomonadota bacterium]
MDAAKELGKRVDKEVWPLLLAQLEKLGLGERDLCNLKESGLLKRRFYPDDPTMLYEYVLDGKTILEVRIEPNHIRFVSPDIETQKGVEVHGKSNSDQQGLQG